MTTAVLQVLIQFVRQRFDPTLETNKQTTAVDNGPVLEVTQLCNGWTTYLVGFTKGQTNLK